MSTQRNQFKAPTNHEIAICAYHIWEREGKLPGKDVVYWLQAEKQLIADRKQDAGLPLTVRAIQSMREKKDRGTRLASGSRPR